MRVEGRLLDRGAPQAGGQVLLADEAARAVLAAVETGADGAWALTVPAGAPAELLVFARCRGAALGVAFARTAAGGAPLDLEMTDVAPTHALTVVLDGVPGDLAPQIRMTPRELDGLDPALLRWVRTPVDGARGGALAGFTPADQRLERRVQAGVWWITAALLYDSSGQMPGQALPDSWFAVAAHTGDGAALTAHRDGFLLRVTGPVTVTLRLEPRPTSMLD
jgi:hypothetical protein